MKIENNPIYIFTLPSGLEIRLSNPDRRDLEYLDRAFGLRLDAGLNLRITNDMGAVFTATDEGFQLRPGDELVCYRKDAPKPQKNRPARIAVAAFKSLALCLTL